jgi:hypothetical protein
MYREKAVESKREVGQGHGVCVSRPKIQSRGVLWLVESDLATAGQLDGGFDSPTRFVDLGAPYVLRLQEFDLLVQVITHEIEDGSQQVMTSVKLLAILALGGMDSYFRGRKFEDQPAVTGVHPREVQDVAKEGAIGFGTFAGDQDVSADKHAE